MLDRVLCCRLLLHIARSSPANDASMTPRDRELKRTAHPRSRTNESRKILLTAYAMRTATRPLGNTLAAHAMSCFTDAAVGRCPEPTTARNWTVVCLDKWGEPSNGTAPFSASVLARLTSSSCRPMSSRRRRYYRICHVDVDDATPCRAILVNRSPLPDRPRVREHNICGGCTPRKVWLVDRSDRIVVGVGRIPLWKAK